MSRVLYGATALALLVVTLLLFPPPVVEGDLGLWLPSPNQWHLPHLAGWLINVILLFCSVAVMITANKKYNFIPEAHSEMPWVLVLLLAANCITTTTLSTSSLLLLCNTLCLFIIISTYEERNASREFFIIGTVPAIGAMVQYSFLVMIPVYIGAGLLMKSFRFREFIAFCFGLLAPYWIAVGLGLASPLSLRLPDSLTLPDKSAAVNHNVFLTLLQAGLMAMLGFILSLYNLVKLFSRNSRLRCIHLSFNIMAAVVILAMIFDFNNFVAYYGTLALWVAIEAATLLHFYPVRKPWLMPGIIMLVFLPLYILTL